MLRDESRTSSKAFIPFASRAGTCAPWTVRYSTVSRRPQRAASSCGNTSRYSASDHIVAVALPLSMGSQRKAVAMCLQAIWTSCTTNPCIVPRDNESVRHRCHSNGEYFILLWILPANGDEQVPISSTILKHTKRRQPRRHPRRQPKESTFRPRQDGDR